MRVADMYASTSTNGADSTGGATPLPRSASLACLLARSASPNRAQAPFGM